jgi:protocatechuate 3,4-dioxygenase beta subunit
MNAEARSHDRSRTPQPPLFEGRPLAHPDEAVFDQGLAFDLETHLSRRGLLKVAGYGGLSAGLLAIAGCAPSGGASTGGSATGATSAASAGASSGGSAAAGADCDTIPEETAGPFPGDGSNGPDVLGQSGVVREDIRTSFGGLSGTAAGVPLTIRLAIQDASNDCAAMPGAAVYVWHCDRDGNYSLYSQAAVDQNYLRGVQAAGDDGVVTFTSIFPACYQGRWPHIHFEVYPSLEAATDEANKIATSQVALPKEACDAVYATPGYESSVRTLSQVSLASDMVFSDDGAAHQLGTIGGDVAGGLTVDLAAPVETA